MPQQTGTLRPYLGFYARLDPIEVLSSLLHLFALCPFVVVLFEDAFAHVHPLTGDLFWNVLFSVVGCCPFPECVRGDTRWALAGRVVACRFTVVHLLVVRTLVRVVTR